MEEKGICVVLFKEREREIKNDSRSKRRKGTRSSRVERNKKKAPYNVFY